MTNALHFVETTDDVNNLIHNISNYENSNDYLIAITAEAQAEVSRAGRPYINTISFYGPQGHQSVLTKSVEMFKHIRANWEFKDDMGVQHAYERTIVFYLRFYLHYLLVNLHVTARAIEKKHPEVVSVPPSTSPSEIPLNMTRNVSLLGEIVSCYLAANNLKIQIECDNQRELHITKRAYSASLLHGLVNTMLMKLFRYSGRGRPFLFAAADSYNMPNLLDRITNIYPRLFPLFLQVSRKRFVDHFRKLFQGKQWFLLPADYNAPAPKQPEIQVAIQRLVRSIEEDNTETYFFEGVDLRFFLIPYLRNGALNGLSKLNVEIKRIDKILKRSEPALAIAQYALGAGYALGEICSARGIPAMLVSHGTHVVQNNDTYAHIEWGEHARTLINTHFPYVAVQSPLANQFLESCSDLKSKKIITGPLLFARKVTTDESKEEVRRRLFGNHAHEKIVLHAGTPKGRYSIRPWVYETVDEYIRNINDAIAAVEELQGVFLAIRFRPSEDLSEEDFRCLIHNSESCEVYSDGAFDDYLLASDMLLSYSSTTIEEALQNKVPVLQYDSDGKYAHIEDAPSLESGEESIPSAIYYCSCYTALGRSINTICELRERLVADAELWTPYVYPVDDELSWCEPLFQDESGK